MDAVLKFLMAIWTYFAQNILQQPAFMIGLIVLVGYLLEKKKWYEVISGFLKATVGYFILVAGSNGLVQSFRPIIVGLKDRFHLHAMVIDPYFGQNAVTVGIMKRFGRSFADTMLLLLFAYIINILLVRFQKYTKLRSVFTTGNVQVQQAATAFWLFLFCFPHMGRLPILIVMSIVLGLYWAVGSNLTVGITQELTDGADFAIAHQQMFGIFFFAKLSEWLSKRAAKKGKKVENKRLEDIELPGFLSMFNDNMVSTSILMLFFFGIILVVLGPTYLIHAGFMEKGQSFFFYILQTSLMFAVYLAILQLGVRTFVNELTESFTGISDRWLPGSVPGIDVAAVLGFGSPNAATIGFMFGALGQFLMIGLLLIMHSPTIVVAGFIPPFFDNAAIGVYCNNRGGYKYAMICPFISGLVQVAGSAFIATWVGMASYGGYLGMFDWATVWPFFTVIMKYLGYVGIAVVALILIIIPQLQYRADPEGYFLVTKDYEAWKKLHGKSDAE
jgi:PTS system ascorbate-specific IIC component